MPASSPDSKQDNRCANANAHAKRAVLDLEPSPRMFLLGGRRSRRLPRPRVRLAM